MSKLVKEGTGYKKILERYLETKHNNPKKIRTQEYKDINTLLNICEGRRIKINELLDKNKFLEGKIKELLGE